MPPLIKPAQTPIKTNISNFNGPETGYTGVLGYRFQVNVDGAITGLWDYSGGGTKTLKLWDSAGNLLGSTTVTSINGVWKMGTFAAPVRITAGIYYTVTDYITNNWYAYEYPSYLPLTYGNVSLYDGCYANTDRFPSYPTDCYTDHMVHLIGIPDINFIPF